MRRLIINADDLGLSSVVNERIEDCIRREVVTSSTLLANAPCFDDGVRIAKQYTNISVGAHLNLIEFAPLTNVSVFRKHGIVSDDGNFIEGAIYCVPIDDELKEAIYEEWDAQLCKIESAGIIPTHCDSHQHTHAIEELQNVLCRVMEKHHIRKVRRKIVPELLLMLRGQKRPPVKFDKSKAIMPPKRNLLYRRFFLLKVIYTSGRWNKRMQKQFKLTDSFYAFNSFFYDFDYLQKGGMNSVMELMCHPGLSEFDEETENLLKKKDWLSHSYEMISYKELL